jgi:hypothetical protein
MTLTTHPSPAPCSTGTWMQRWNCGWHEPATTASHTGSSFGHNLVPLLIIAAIVIAAAVSNRRRNQNASGRPVRRAWRNWDAR